MSGFAIDPPVEPMLAKLAEELPAAGAFLYVCNQSSKNITKFQINQETGGLPSNTIAATTNLAPQALVFAK